MASRLPDPAHGGRPPPLAGCLLAGVVFVAATIIAWLAAMLLYGLIVEKWQWVEMRRDFGFDWALLYAPLIALGAGTAAGLWASRRAVGSRVIPWLVVIGIAGFLGLAAIFGIGLI